MAWQGDGNSTSTHIPAGVRRGVRRRDGGTCQLQYEGCTGKHQEFDHIEGVAAQGVQRKDTLTIDQLQCACRPCHLKKTLWQASQGRGQGTREPERDHRMGQVPTPEGFRYAPP